jgi:hypothetical protein
MNEVKTLEQRQSQLGFSATQRLVPDGPWLDTQAKPRTDQGQNREISWTYIAQVSDNLPHPRFVQPGESASILPEEMSQVPKLAQLRLDVQCLILFPAVDVRQHVRVSGAWSKCHRMCIRQMSENLDLLAQSKSSKN